MRKVKKKIKCFVRYMKDVLRIPLPRRTNYTRQVFSKKKKQILSKNLFYSDNIKIQREKKRQREKHTYGDRQRQER